MRRLVLLVPLAVLLVGCGGDGGGGGPKESKGTMDCKISGDESKAELATLEDGKTYKVAVKTNKGDFTFKLATDISPCTTASFVGVSTDAEGGTVSGGAPLPVEKGNVAPTVALPEVSVTFVCAR